MILDFSGGSSDIKKRLKTYFENISLAGKTVVDIPAGSGYISKVMHDRGAKVSSYDLFPKFFEQKLLACQYANLSKTLPIENHYADFILCQEGIEHLENQLFALQEFNRILKPGGRLWITTPNISHIRAKLSHLFVESSLFKRLPENELSALWFAEDGRQYYGHMFLIGIQRLRVLAKIAGFELAKVHSVKASNSSLLFGIILYPLILVINLISYYTTYQSLINLKKTTKREIRSVLNKIVYLNLHPTILFGKHLFIEFKKERELEEHLNVVKSQATIS
ncbi:class I SAM-dependent methyltransferase [Nitrospira defluvii]|nr:class I SAM-dependent methyltransferase [Nitrospira defluvii]